MAPLWQQESFELAPWSYHFSSENNINILVRFMHQNSQPVFPSSCSSRPKFPSSLSQFHSVLPVQPESGSHHPPVTSCFLFHLFIKQSLTPVWACLAFLSPTRKSSNKMHLVELHPRDSICYKRGNKQVNNHPMFSIYYHYKSYYFQLCIVRRS